MLTRSVSKWRDQKIKWANETKMCSFAGLLVRMHGTLASAVCWRSIVLVFLQGQTSGPFCLIVGGLIIGSRSNAKDGASRQPFTKAEELLLYSFTFCIPVLSIFGNCTACSLLHNGRGTRCRGGFEFSQNFLATWEFYFFILIWLSHLALTTLFQLRFERK